MLLSIIILSLSQSVPTTIAGQLSHVKDNIYLWTNTTGGNVVIFKGKQDVFLIDDQIKERSKNLNKVINSIGGGNVKYVINTHYHFDHTEGNEYFGDKNAVIIAHENVHKRLSTRQFITLFNREMPPLKTNGLPTITFSDKLKLRVESEEIEAHHVLNAHTDGDIIITLKKRNILVTGDLVFHERYPLIDTEHGGSVKGLLHGVDKLITLSNPQTIIIPGHGPLMDIEALKKYRSMLTDIVNKIQSAIDKNMSLKQVLKMQITKAFDNQMEPKPLTPQMFVSIIYNDLNNQKN